jgi:ubiquinone/menaquinone biosynthesis C-methylase UbiE
LATKELESLPSRPWTSLLVAAVLRLARNLPLLGEEPAGERLSAAEKSAEPFWQTQLEMRRANDQKFFGLFGFTESILRDKTVLDLGCGYGGNILSWSIRHPSTRLVGLEPFSSMLKSGKLAGISHGCKNTSFVSGLGEFVPFHDETFDIIMAYDVIEHVQDPMRVMTEVIRCLRPGGFYLGAFPPYYSPMAHHLTYVTRLPFLHHVFSPGVLVAAVNRLVETGDLDIHHQPAPQRGPWGRITLPSLNGTTVADWAKLSRILESRYMVGIKNTYVPFGHRIGPMRVFNRIVLSLFPHSDLFCGQIRTVLHKRA